MRRDQRNNFLDIEAEVEKDEEAEEEDEDGPADGFIADMHPDDFDALPPGAERDDRRHRELDRQREMEASMDAEKQAQALKERYGRNRGAATTDSMVVPKTLLLPSVEDPSIWGVKCKPGKEKEVVFGIMKRIEERMFSRNPVPIISAFHRTGMSTGYIYVEARRQNDILGALDGIQSVYPRSDMTLIPIKEMPDLLRIKKSEPLKLGGYVRIKRGKYAGDLAQIEEVETNGLGVTVKVVPRLDYGVNEHDPTAPRLDPKDAKRKRAAASKNTAVNRPPPRLFNENEAKKHHRGFLSSNAGLGKKSFTYLNETYIEGYLIKDFKVQHLQTEGVNPSLAEVTQFIRGGADGADELDLAALAKTLKNSVSADSYLPGDIVEVYEGEQKGVFGKTVTVRGDIVTLKIEEGELKGQTIDAPVKTLRKRFREGDHVKVIGGSKFRDEVGMVVRIKDERVTLVTDLNQQEITVFSKDLREASDASAAPGLGLYDVQDLLQLE
jgi:transcription elongation factor SPT5